MKKENISLIISVILITALIVVPITLILGINYYKNNNQVECNTIEEQIEETKDVEEQTNTISEEDIKTIEKNINILEKTVLLHKNELYPTTLYDKNITASEISESDRINGILLYLDNYYIDNTVESNVPYRDVEIEYKKLYNKDMQYKVIKSFECPEITYISQTNEYFITGEYCGGTTGILEMTKYNYKYEEENDYMHVYGAYIILTTNDNDEFQLCKTYDCNEILETIPEEKDYDIDNYVENYVKNNYKILNNYKITFKKENNKFYNYDKIKYYYIFESLELI